MAADFWSVILGGVVALIGGVVGSMLEGRRQREAFQRTVDLADQELVRSRSHSAAVAIEQLFHGVWHSRRRLDRTNRAQNVDRDEREAVRAERSDAMVAIDRRAEELDPEVRQRFRELRDLFAAAHNFSTGNREPEGHYHTEDGIRAELVKMATELLAAHTRLDPLPERSRLLREYLWHYDKLGREMYEVLEDEIHNEQMIARVSAGSVVTVEWPDGARDELLYGSVEQRPDGLDVCSPASPLGTVLAGACVGESLTFRTPAGDQTVTVTAIGLVAADHTAHPSGVVAA